MFRYLFAFCLMVPSTMFYGASIMFLGILRAPRKLVDSFMAEYGRTALFALRTPLADVIWHCDPAELPDQMVVVCNHESHLDGPALLTTVGRVRSLRFVGKKTLFRIPFLGWGLYGSGNVPVSRHDAKRDINTLSNERARARDKDIVFFAEGTRSLDGTLKDFKKGAFAFALKHRRPILPVAVAGGYESLTPHTYLPKGGRIAVVVGQPISLDGMTFDDREQLRAIGRASVEQLRQQALQLVGSSRA